MLDKKVTCSRCGVSFSVDKNDIRDEYICIACQDKMAEEVRKKEEARQVKENDRKLELLDLSKYPKIDRSQFASDIDYYVEVAYVIVASDIHLKAASYPCIRKGGVLYKVEDRLLTNEEIIDFINSHHLATLTNDSTKALDFSFGYKDVRFRANFYHSVKGVGLALRLLKLLSTDFSVLGLPEKLKEISDKSSGLIMITGPTSSGKTTTLAALVDYINHNKNFHIVSLEDPIEYLFEDRLSVITQKEMRRDFTSFGEAIPELMREDPDIIIVGEMRDKESIEAALRAAETGHLVFSTLHTRGAVSTISRIIDIFPPDQQDQIRTQLSMCLLGVLSQQLLPSTDDGKRVLATEFMIANTSISSSIKSKNLAMVANSIELGGRDGMYTMKSSLEALHNQGKISDETLKHYIELK